MNFGFSDEQELLRAEVRKFLDQNCPIEEVRKLAETSEGFSRSLWERSAELGWVGLTFPEAHGGMSLAWVDLVVVLEEMGRSLYPSPLIPTVLAGSAIASAGSDAQRERWLPGLANGSAIGTLATLEAGDSHALDGIQLTGRRDGDAWRLDGEKLFVCDAGSADLFALTFRTGPAPGDVSLAVLERGTPGLSAESLPTLDATKRLGRVRLDGVRVSDAELLGSAGSAGALVTGLLDRGAIAVTAEMVGAAEGAIALTVGYANQRIQFGEPIGRFQGVKHPLAEMFVDVESYKSLVYYAAWAIDAAPDAVPLAASRAKAYASDAFARIGVDAIQLHGGIGYTWEYDAQLYLKRAKWARPIFGDSDFHYARIAALGGL